MKKIFFFAGLAAVGYSFYYFFKRQIGLALDFDYELKNLRVVELTNKAAKIKTSIEVYNKSSFQITIKSYDILFMYQGIPIADTRSDVPVLVKSDGSFTIDIIGDINLEKAKNAVLPFVSDVINKKPINLSMKGYVDISFLKINHRVNLEGQQVTYSTNLLKDYGLEKGFDKIKTKFDTLFSKIGLNL